MKVHCCLLDKECRQYGAPARIELGTKNWIWYIAFWPGSQTQRWNSRYGYNWPPDKKNWRWITRHPQHRCNKFVGMHPRPKPGPTVLHARPWEEGQMLKTHCGRRLGHKGQCWDWRKKEYVDASV